jgi:hypothetical protein
VGLEHAQPCTPALYKVPPASTDCTLHTRAASASCCTAGNEPEPCSPQAHVPRPPSHLPALNSASPLLLPQGLPSSLRSGDLLLHSVPFSSFAPTATAQLHNRRARARHSFAPLHTLLNSFSALYFAHTPTRTHAHTPAPIPLPPPPPTTTTTNTQITPFGLDRTPPPTPDAFQRPRIITTNLPPQYMEFALAPLTQAA